MWDLSSLTRDLTQIPLQWDYAVLTTGAPGKAGGPIKKKKKKKQKKKQKKKKGLSENHLGEIYKGDQKTMGG